MDYPNPIAICIEDVDALSDAVRYLQCIALPGDVRGLALSRKGEVTWQQPKTDGCELWVSADRLLMLLRPGGAISITVHRGGRSLKVPEEQPVVLLDQDEIEIENRLLCIHLHGETDEDAAAPPSWLPMPESTAGALAKAAAAALVIGATIAGSGCKSQVGEQQRQRPVPTAPATPGTPQAQDAAVPGTPPSSARPPIEVRRRPPKPAPRRRDAGVRKPDTLLR